METIQVANSMWLYRIGVENGTEYGLANFKKCTQETACGPCDFLITHFCLWNVKSAFEDISVKDNYAPIKACCGNWISQNFRMSKIL